MSFNISDPVMGLISGQGDDNFATLNVETLARRLATGIDSSLCHPNLVKSNIGDGTSVTTLRETTGDVEEFKRTAVSSSLPPSPNPKPQSSPQISKDEIIELTAKASQKALEDYEIVRKKRKAEKKKLEAEEKHRQQIRQTIQNAVKGPQRDNTFDF